MKEESKSCNLNSINGESVIEAWKKSIIVFLKSCEMRRILSVVRIWMLRNVINSLKWPCWRARIIDFENNWKQLFKSVKNGEKELLHMN